MITKVNNTNKDEYSVFFEKVSTAVSTAIGNDVVIGSLAEYFNRLETIKGLPNAAKYLALPLDEPFFEIDTNTRNILVPAEFRRNGVGVVGDSMAESLFFSVDRYFDIQDLAQDDIQIYIQWETPAPNSVKGYSKPWLEDIDSEPGKLIFAWAIPSMLTRTAGNLKFSVRFQQLNAEETAIVYDLSTLPQTIKINSGLNFDLNNVVVDETSPATITSRLQNSSIGGVFVPQPTFYVCTPTAILADNTLTSTKATQDLKISAYPAGSTNYTSLVYSLSRDGDGVVSTIEIDKDNPLGEVQDSAPTVVVTSSAYENTNDAVVNSNKIYYENEAGAFKVVTTARAEELGVEQLYELIITFTIKTAGTYRLSVVASYSGPDSVTGVTINSTSKEAYRTWIFEKPTAFIFGDNVDASTAKFEPKNTGVVNFVGTESIGLRVIAPIDTNNSAEQQNGAEYTAKLMRKVGAAEPVLVATSDLITPTAAGSNTYEFTTDINVNGDYYIEMSKSLNNCAIADQPVATSGMIRVTEALSAPVVAKRDTMITDVIAVGSLLECDDSLATDPNGYEIKKSYQWYKSTSGSTKPAVGPVDGSNIRTNWAAKAGATGPEYRPTEAGYYSLVVTVSRNGDLRRGNSEIFTVYQI